MCSANDSLRCLEVILLLLRIPKNTIYESFWMNSWLHFRMESHSWVNWFWFLFALERSRSVPKKFCSWTQALATLKPFHKTRTCSCLSSLNVISISYQQQERCRYRAQVYQRNASRHWIWNSLRALRRRQKVKLIHLVETLFITVYDFIWAVMIHHQQ